MKSLGKHRRSGNGNGPRSGAAALMIGGLVAGTVATAGAVTLKNPDASEALASTVRADLAPVAEPAPTTADADSRQAALSNLRSSSLSEIRDQVGADRSEARSAPADADAVEVVLATSGFTGHTPEVEEAEEPAAQEAPAAEATQESGEAAQVTQTRNEPAPTRQEAPARQQAAPAPAPEPEAAPAPAPEPAPAPVGGSVLGIAAAYVGSPYVLPGNPPYTFDCSSYTWWVFQQAGISIPRTVSGQKGAVTPVSNPQPGDLIFYNDFYHVGIYAGNGMTYEALNPSTGVRYGPLVNTNVWYGRIG